MHNRALEGATTAAIVANLGILGWSWLDHDHEAWVADAENAVLGFFCAEMSLRMAMERGAFWKSKWNWFDLAVTVLSALPFIAESFTALRVVRGARLVHTLRHASSLRFVEIRRRYKLWRFKRQFEFIPWEEMTA